MAKNTIALKATTCTVMVYTNLELNAKAISEVMKKRYDKTVIPIYTKKTHTLDKKKMWANYGSIIGARYGETIIGLDTRKKKKKTKKRIEDFLNQIAIDMSIGEGEEEYTSIFLNFMAFNRCIKIAGAKSMDMAIEGLMILWEDYIFKDKNCWKLREGETHPKFIFDLQMSNLKFGTGFKIDRYKFEEVFANEKIQHPFKDDIKISIFEPSVNAVVKLKFNSFRPSNYKYDMIEYPKNKAIGSYVKENIFDVKKTKKKNDMTFIIFSSGQGIVSGKYDTERIREKCIKYLDFVKKNRSLFEQKINSNVEFLNIKDFTV